MIITLAEKIKKKGVILFHAFFLSEFLWEGTKTEATKGFATSTLDCLEASKILPSSWS